MPERNVKVADIVVPRKRMRTANHVEELASSIAQNGLLHALTLRADEGRLILVAGRRRLEAVRLLQWDTVKANVLTIDQTQALLIEIDENLQRAELTALQHAQHIAERKKIWEAMHPQTKTGGTEAEHDPKTGRLKGKKKRQPPKNANSATFGNGHPTPSFVEDTARKTQTPKRTVAKSAQIGEGICRQAQKLLEDTPLEDRKEDLLKLSRIKDKDEQVAIARKVHDGEATTFLRAKKTLEAERIRAEPEPLPTGPFRVVVADPPWRYDKRSEDGTKKANTEYATMDTDAVKALAVKEIAEKDAVLWLWTTNAHLPEAFAVVRSWGFTYKTLLTWDKGRIGVGDWLRGQTEHCLFCTRGKPTVELTGQSTLVREMRTDHSRKPDAFYQLVESLCPGSRVELFARQKRPGWYAWGAELATEVE